MRVIRHARGRAASGGARVRMNRTRSVAWGRRRGRLLASLAAVVPLGMLGAFALTGTAAAAVPAGCSQAQNAVTCTFSYTGAAQSFTVPASVTSITVDAQGAAPV